MTGAEFALVHQQLDAVGKTQQAQHVGHVTAAFAHGLGEVFLGIGKFVDEPLVAFGFLQGVEILALEVFHQGYFQGFAVAEVLDDDRNFVKFRLLRRPPAPLPGDDFIGHGLIGMAAHQDGLDDAPFFDGVHQAFDFLFVEHPPWLEPSRMDKLNGNGLGQAHPVEFGVIFLVVTKKRRKALA